MHHSLIRVLAGLLVMLLVVGIAAGAAWLRTESRTAQTGGEPVRSFRRFGDKPEVRMLTVLCLSMTCAVGVAAVFSR